MTLDQARKLRQEINELKRRYGITYSDFHEEERDGELRFVNITLKAKIDPPLGVQSQTPQGKKKIS